jgi:hypothetical protein
MRVALCVMAVLASATVCAQSLDSVPAAKDKALPQQLLNLDNVWNRKAAGKASTPFGAVDMGLWNGSAEGLTSSERAIDHTGAPRMLAMNNTVSVLPDWRNQPRARAKPIPTEWPDLKKELIPTTWPALKLLRIDGSEAAQSGKE